MTVSTSRALPLLTALAAAVAALAPIAARAAFAEPPVPAIGTRTVATADLLVKRPGTTPCTVPLFDGVDFIGFTPTPLAYTPPAGCAGAWSKVVLEADYDVSAGRQFDRTAVIHLDGVNLYFGTTMEPGSATARAWHVERDVTALSSWLRGAHAGEAILGNIVDGTYTGHIHGSARLVFYPAGSGYPAAPSAQAVVPLAPSLTALSPSHPSLDASVTLPRNTERLYLDVIAQSQASDEFWYTCVPDADADVLQSCPGGAFREVEVAIDGTPAGVAPVFPWIYTGGIDPHLWTPIPGVQTLDFTPSRVDLTPFAGLLDDGAAHTVSVSVSGAQDNFSVTATLLAWTDPGATVVTGGVTRNTLAAPVVKVNDSSLVVDGANAHGKVFTSATRDFTIAGTVNTSHGTVATTLDTHLTFKNVQNFLIDDTHYDQDIDQHTDMRTLTTVTTPGGSSTKQVISHFPLRVTFAETVTGDQAILDTTISQTRRVDTLGHDKDGSSWKRLTEDTVAPHVTTTYDLNTGIGTSTNQTSHQHFMKRDEQGCYDRTITVADNAVTAVNDLCTGGGQAATRKPATAAPAGQRK